MAHGPLPSAMIARNVLATVEDCFAFMLASVVVGTRTVVHSAMATCSLYLLLKSLISLHPFSLSAKQSYGMGRPHRTSAQAARSAYSSRSRAMWKHVQGGEAALGLKPGRDKSGGRPGAHIGCASF